MTEPLPTLALIKAQAKRLRQLLASEGTPISHSQALEMIADHHGYRDWNTLCARLNQQQAPVVVSQAVSGRYLGHAFTARVRSVEPERLGYWRVRLQLDKAIDVVASAHFSSLRHQLTVILDAQGVTQEFISTGDPVLQLRLPASR